MLASLWHCCDDDETDEVERTDGGLDRVSPLHSIRPGPKNPYHLCTSIGVYYTSIPMVARLFSHPYILSSKVYSIVLTSSFSILKPPFFIRQAFLLYNFLGAYKL